MCRVSSAAITAKPTASTRSGRLLSVRNQAITATSRLMAMDRISSMVWMAA
ncbi:hypothetical protein D3C72_2001810 [compost metagenome]